HLEAQAQQARDEARLEQDLTLLLSRLEDFAAQVKEGLQIADWLTRREIIRELVKRVEVEQQQVRVVFRVGPLDPPHLLAKKRIVCNIVRGVTTPPWGVPARVGEKSTPSMTPAMSHPLIRCLIAG